MKGLMRFPLLGAVWAFVYALPAVPIEGLSNVGIDFPFTNAVDMWPMELGLPGLVGGLVFAALLALTGRLGRFETMPVARLVAWGAFVGLLLGAVYHLTSLPNPARVIAVIFGLAVPLGAIAAPASAFLFRVIGRRRGVPATNAAR